MSLGPHQDRVVRGEVVEHLEFGEAELNTTTTKNKTCKLERHDNDSVNEKNDWGLGGGNEELYWRRGEDKSFCI